MYFQILMNNILKNSQGIILVKNNFNFYGILQQP
ncbi:unnamed protein product [Paramecium sonneborni]|uniref:Uncharacterized protein n=1 Tax=Paramecium sonneborni TaxID=65129 RepID=A0A8S1RRP5_9CILI|nr:unnamed protein product [Paramecium sonneborni]